MSRSRWFLGISLTIALICTTAPLAVAGTSGSDGVPPGGDRILRGKTSQGERIQFVMHRIGGGWGIEEIDLGVLLRCEDGTRTGVGQGIGFFGPQPLDDHNRFALDEAFTGEALHIRGRIGPRGGSGTFEETFAALTSDEQAQTCTSKPATWSVERTSPALNTPCCTPRASETLPVLTMTMRVRGGDAVSVSRSWNSGRSELAPAGRRARFYSGSTSQGEAVDFTTAQFDQGWRLKDADLGFRMRCEDGSRFGLGTGWGFGGTSGPRLDASGDFGFDSVDIFEGFHLHGRLGAHGGSGTAADVEPGLTKDEQAMLCTSKDRSWSAKRATPAPPPSGGGQPAPRAGTSSTAVTLRTTTR